MRNLKRWISALLAVVLLLSYGITGTVYAENQDHHSQAGGGMYGSDSTLVDSDYDGIPDEYDDYLNYLTAVTPQGIAEELNALGDSDYLQLLRKADAGRRFVMENKNEYVQADRVYQLIKQLF